MPTIEEVFKELRQVYDPEIPVNIVDLGLIYHLELTPGERGGQKVAAKMMMMTIQAHLPFGFQGLLSMLRWRCWCW